MVNVTFLCLNEKTKNRKVKKLLQGPKCYNNKKLRLKLMSLDSMSTLVSLTAQMRNWFRKLQNIPPVYRVSCSEHFYYTEVVAWHRNFLTFHCKLNEQNKSVFQFSNRLLQSTVVVNNIFSLCPWEDLKFSRKDQRKTQVTLTQSKRERLQKKVNTLSGTSLLNNWF